MKSRDQFYITVFFLESIIKLIHAIVSKYDCLVWLDEFFFSFIENEKESIFFLVGIFSALYTKYYLLSSLLLEKIELTLEKQKVLSNDNKLKLRKK